MVLSAKTVLLHGPGDKIQHEFGKRAKCSTISYIGILETATALSEERAIRLHQDGPA